MGSKFIGGILLIIGTSIGGGMLALPVANAGSGFINSSLFLFFCWALMTSGAFFILEANLWLPKNTNMISMAQATLGRVGQVITWIIYLLLLYALLSAYISGGSDVLQSLLALIDLNYSQSICAIIFVIIFGYIVFRGIRSVDYVNRGLMFGKLAVYFLLVLLIVPHIQWPYLLGGQLSYVSGTLMVLITSFGFSTIVPSLRTYFNDDVTKLRQAIVIGSLIPLFFYIIWDAVIMGVLHRHGSQGLLVLMQSTHPTSGLTDELKVMLANNTITDFFRFFTSICMLTAFLGVSLCLYDFLADGLQLKKKNWQAAILLALTFLPPLMLVIFSPGIFIKALAYAGILCVVLLVLLPALMVWIGRYHRGLTGSFTVPGGKLSLLITIIVALSLILIDSVH